MAFLRQVSLQIAPSAVNGVIAPAAIDVSDLRVRFKVVKDLKPTPNHAEIEVFNLGEQNRAFLENQKSKSKALAVRLEAGYVDDGVGQIYLGDIRNADSFKTESEWVTKMSTDDKGRKFQTVRINVPIGPGMPLLKVFELLFDALGIGYGNLKKTMGELTSMGVTSLHPNGGVLSGYVAQEITDLCNSAGLEWSIQDGVVYIVVNGVADKTQSPYLSSDSGLIGSPTIDNEGIVTAHTVMIPTIRPGIVVNFDSEKLKGGYRVTKCEYHGDTHGDAWHSWHIKFNAKKY